MGRLWDGYGFDRKLWYEMVVDRDGWRELFKVASTISWKNKIRGFKVGKTVFQSFIPRILFFRKILQPLHGYWSNMNTCTNFGLSIQRIKWIVCKLYNDSILYKPLYPLTGVINNFFLIFVIYNNYMQLICGKVQYMKRIYYQL